MNEETIEREARWKELLGAVLDLQRLEEGAEYVVRLSEPLEAEAAAEAAAVFKDLRERLGCGFTVLVGDIELERRPDPERLQFVRDELRQPLVEAFEETFAAGALTLEHQADAALDVVAPSVEELEGRIHGMREGVVVALTALDVAVTTARGKVHLERPDEDGILDLTIHEWWADHTAETRRVLDAVLGGEWDDSDALGRFVDEGEGDEVAGAVDEALGPEDEEAESDE